MRSWPKPARLHQSLWRSRATPKARHPSGIGPWIWLIRDDADLSQLLGTATFPPKAYCTALILPVLRKAGLRSFADEELFLRAAQRAESQVLAARDVESASALLNQLRRRFHSLKWSSRQGRTHLVLSAQRKCLMLLVAGQRKLHWKGCMFMSGRRKLSWVSTSFGQKYPGRVTFLARSDNTVRNMWCCW